jgi:hypothetical protein|nr:MAG TPA: hypothetical protein [Caudoviricetes sp.]
MIKLSNIFDNIDEFIERIKSSNIWNEDKQFILNIFETPYKISNIAHWKDLYNVLLNGFTKNSRDYVSLFDYTKDELNFIFEYVNQSESERINFIKLSISKILKSNEFQEFIKSLNKYDISNLFNLKVTKEEINRTTYFEFIVNGIKIGEYKLGIDKYLGKNSNIRSISKKASDLNYNSTNIRKLMNSLFNFDDNESLKIYSYDDVEKIFKSDYHNVRWGYTGPSKPTNKIIIDKLQELYNKINEYTK